MGILRKSKNYKADENYEDNNIFQNIGTGINPDDTQVLAANNLLKILTDLPAEEDALDFQHYSANLANVIRGTTIPQFAIGIFGEWGIGKTTLMRMIEGKLKENDIPTVWFDAWRFEREEHSALIPFLRTFGLSMEEYIRGLKLQGKLEEANNWEALKKGLSTTLIAFLKSTKVSYGVKDIIAVETDFEKLYNALDENTPPGSDISLLYYDAIRYLQNAMRMLPEGRRVVVFVDDLDRCSPEKALEVLESIKNLMDINGIVFVVGMNPDTINSLVKKKFPDERNIDAPQYLAKFIQLPFQIPLLDPRDIESFIEKIVSKALGLELAAEFLSPMRKSLIAKGVEPNPRLIKRFLNNIILAKGVFGQYVDFDRLIAVQTLIYRRDWNIFLELISQNDDVRKTFFGEYYIPLRGEGKGIRNKDALDNFIKDQSHANRPLPKEITHIFQELIKHDDLMSLLDEGVAEIFRGIDRMENYRRALKSTKLLEKE
jgi:hypothetical protein